MACIIHVLLLPCKKRLFQCTVGYTGQVTFNKEPEKQGHVYLVRLYLFEDYRRKHERKGNRKRGNIFFLEFIFHNRWLKCPEQSPKIINLQVVKLIFRRKQILALECNPYRIQIVQLDLALGDHSVQSVKISTSFG